MSDELTLDARLVRINTYTGFVFKATDSDYVVARAEIDGTEQTICGDIYKPQFGVSYQISGEWTTHPRFGKQFKFSSSQLLQPESADGIAIFLAENLEGIGSRISEALIQHYGVKTLDVLRNDPSRAASEIRGLSLEVAQLASEHLQEIDSHQKATIQLYGLLSPFGFHKARIKKVMNRLGIDAVSKIQHNPYCLTRVSGIGFQQADRAWMGIKKDANAIERQLAALQYTMQQVIQQEGHTWIRRDFWINHTIQECGVTISDNAVEQLLQCHDEWLVHSPNFDAVVRDEEGNQYSTAFMDRCEQLIAEKVAELNREKAPLDWNFEEEILYPEQRQALGVLMDWRFTILTGKAGTGKTLAASIFLKKAHDLGLQVMACAPTGKAARRLTELLTTRECPLIATTIHKMLEPEFAGQESEDEKDKLWSFRRNASFPFDADLIFMDESSMVSIDLFRHFLNAVDTERTRVVLVGDPAQLPPVGPGCPLRDLLAAEVPHFELQTVWRNGGIALEAANLIREGRTFRPADQTYLENGKNWRHLETATSEVPDTVLRLVQSLSKKYQWNTFSDIQVIVPVKSRGACSAKAINAHLQEKLNPVPFSEDLVFQKDGQPHHFKVGDKVVHRRNEHLNGWNLSDMDWDSLSDEEKNAKAKKAKDKVFVLNGDFGLVIHSTNTFRIVQFFDPIRYCISYNKDVTELAYAITCHVSQGSEWKCVVFAISKNAGRLINRNLTYTSFTRFKNLLVTVGELNVINRSIKSSCTGHRITKLEQRVRETRLAAREGEIEV